MSDFRMLKYPLFDVNRTVFDDSVVVEMPAYSAHHFLGMQDGVVTLWALVDLQKSKHKRRFHILGTGHVIGFAPHYIGTVFDRAFVWHVFEEFPAAVPA